MDESSDNQTGNAPRWREYLWEHNRKFLYLLVAAILVVYIGGCVMGRASNQTPTLVQGLWCETFATAFPDARLASLIDYADASADEFLAFEDPPGMAKYGLHTGSEVSEALNYIKDNCY